MSVWHASPTSSSMHARSDMSILQEHAGTLVYSFNRCCAEVMAARTDSLFTLLLMLDAVPSSSPNIFMARDTCATAA